MHAIRIVQVLRVEKAIVNTVGSETIEEALDAVRDGDIDVALAKRRYRQYLVSIVVQFGR